MADNIRDFLTGNASLDRKSSLGQAIDSMVNMAAARRRKFERRWFDNNYFDDGFHFRYVSRTTGRIVDLSSRNLGELPIRSIPKASRQIRGVANLLLALEPHPTVAPEPVSRSTFPDTEALDPVTGQMKKEPSKEYKEAIEISKQVALKQGHWLKEEWKEQFLKEKLVEMVILAAKHGVSYLQIWPDPVEEKIQTKVFDAFDIYLLGDLKTISEQPFIIKAVPRLLSEIKADERFEESQVKQLNAENKYATSEVKQAYMQSRYGVGQEADQGATVVQKEAFIKEYLSKENFSSIASKYPHVTEGKKEGDMVMRHIFTAGGVWLKDEYVDLQEYPFVDFRFEPGSIYQTPLIERFIPTNKTLDMIVSRIERHQNSMVVGHWLKRKGENMTINNVPGGLVLEYEGQPPVQGQIAPLPDSLFKFVDLLQMFIEEQGASTSALGNLPPGVRSGVAIESLKSTEYANLKVATDMLRMTVRRISEMFLHIAAEHFVTPQTVRILEQGEPDYFDIIGERGMKVREDINEKPPAAIVIKKDTVVDVDTEPELAYTIQGRRETIQQILNFMVSLQPTGLVTPESIKVLLKKTLEAFQFGSVQEFMEAMDDAAPALDEDTLTKIKIAVVEALRDTGTIGKQGQQQQVDATKVGMVEALKDLGGSPKPTGGGPGAA